MELYEAEHFIKDHAADVRRKGMAADAPNVGEALMAIFLVLDDLMDRVKILDPSEY